VDKVLALFRIKIVDLDKRKKILILKKLKGGVWKMNNVNKSQLIEAVAEKADMSKKDVATVLETTLDTITEELRKKNKVTLTGFGTFKTNDRAARQGRNPQTGETIQIAAATVPKFTAGKGLKEAVK
jgi:nucleoid DNA-binding protein